MHDIAIAFVTGHIASSASQPTNFKDHQRGTDDMHVLCRDHSASRIHADLALDNSYGRESLLFLQTPQSKILGRMHQTVRPVSDRVLPP